jgi:hypothetical protein
LGAAAIARERWPIIPAAVLAMAVLSLGLVDLGPVKPFVRASRAITAGMTPSEVRAAVDAEFPPNGRFHHPVGGQLQDGVMSYVLDPTNGRYDAAILEIRFEGGRCKSVRFLAD